MLYNASVTNETLIVYYLSKELNAQLILIILIRKDYDIVNSFSKKAKTNKIVIKKMYNLNKRINVVCISISIVF